MVTSRRPGASPEATQVPPFLTKTYEMVEDQTTNDAVSWNPDGSGFIVWKPAEFARDMLPKHFKHNNFSSFVRQLNTYGFRKVDPDRWEFANDSFQKGRQDLLKRIHRRKAVSQAVPQQSSTSLLAPNAAIEIGQYGGLKDDVDALIRDKNVLTIELVRLRQQQQWSEQEIRRLSRRLEGAENRQMDMMHLFTKFLQNPSLLSQMFSVANRQKLDRPSGQRKRRARESDQDIEMGETGDDNQIVQYFPHSTPLDGDFAEDLVSLIDNLADSAAHRRLRDSQPEAGRDSDGVEQGSMGGALSDRNGEVAPDLHGVPKVEDPAPVMGIPVFPEGMSASDYLNQVGSLPLPVPSFNDSLPPEPSTSQPLGHHQRPSPFSVGNPGPTPIMSPLDPSMEPGTQGENDEYPVMDDLINGLEGLNSADMIMMDNQLPSDDSMQRDDSFWRQLFLHTGHDKQSPTQDIGTKFDSERVA